MDCIVHGVTKTRLSTFHFSYIYEFLKYSFDLFGDFIENHTLFMLSRLASFTPHYVYKISTLIIKAVVFFFFFLYTMRVLVAQSCLTLYDPMDCSPPGSYDHGILDSEYWNG